MSKLSAGLMPYRLKENNLEVMLVHPGGPFWAKKDLGAWSVPKGEHDVAEDAKVAAAREFQEETGFEPPKGEWRDLGEVKYSNKVVTAWAVEANLDAAKAKSNMFSMEWPPRSGKPQEFPEVDRAEWFSVEVAQTKLVSGQVPLLEALCTKLNIKIKQSDIEVTQPSLFE